MPSYLLHARATWTESTEGLGYRAPDIVTNKEAELFERFEAETNAASRTKAKKLFAHFEASLPSEKRGGASSCSKPEITPPTLATVIPFDPPKR